MKKIKFYIPLLSVGLLLFGGSIWAVIVMKGVPQDLGIRDVTFTHLNQGVCRGCHGDSLADRHHGTQNATTGNCVFCHKVSKASDTFGVTLTRDCMKCHLKSPHHQTQAAKDKKCDECHDTPGLSVFSMKGPNYEPSLITPTKTSCKNCHQGAKKGSNRIFGFKETHHGTGIQDCSVCHAKNKSSKDVRICERCHSVKALHEVKPHVKKSACFGCHGDKIAPKKPAKKGKKKGRKR